MNAAILYFDALSRTAQATCVVIFIGLCTTLILIAVAAARRLWPAMIGSISVSMLSPIGSLFALAAAFLGIEVWANTSSALQATNNEVRALSQAWVIAAALPPATRDGVRADISGYAKLVLDEEWPYLLKIQTPHNPISIRARSYLYSVIDRVTDSGGDKASGTWGGKVADQIEKAFTARTQRITIAINNVNYAKLILSLFLGLALVGLVAITHHQRTSTMIVVTSGTALVVAIVLAFIIASDEPYDPTALLGIDPHAYFDMKAETYGSRAGP